MTLSEARGSVVSVARGLETVPTALVAHRDRGRAERALEILIGRWINVGETTARPGLSPEQIVTSDVYEWAPGGFFVIHSAFGQIGDASVGGVEIIGYDVDEGAYRSRFFDSFGNESLSRLTVTDDLWLWQGERTRCRATFHEGGLMQHALHERSDDGETWEPSMDVTLRKVV